MAGVKFKECGGLVTPLPGDSSQGAYPEAEAASHALVEELTKS